MGITLMVLGAVSFVSGILLYQQGKKEHNEKFNEGKLETVIDTAIADGVLTKNEKQLIIEAAVDSGKHADEVLKSVENRLANSNKKVETEIIDENAKNGLDFEKFVVKKFDSKYFKIIAWAGDKFVDGKYAKTNENPDIIFELSLKDVKNKFAVECKFRSNFYKGGVEFSTQAQFERYKSFEEKEGLPVFIGIGVGGTGEKPERIFMVPLRVLKGPFIDFETLGKYEKKNLEKNFYFDSEKKFIS